VQVKRSRSRGAGIGDSAGGAGGAGGAEEVQRQRRRGGAQCKGPEVQRCRDEEQVQGTKVQSESCRRGAEVLSRCRGSRMVMVIGGAQ
jgi:hypothetical protein